MDAVPDESVHLVVTSPPYWTLKEYPGTDGQVWTVRGASTRHHPAPYPLEIAERLIRMFSFVGDTVLDPFVGTGSTLLAARRWGRHSVGYEIEPEYFEMTAQRLQEHQAELRFGG